MASWMPLMLSSQAGQSDCCLLTNRRRHTLLPMSSDLAHGSGQLPHAALLLTS